jgi:hypothetical protein
VPLPEQRDVGSPPGAPLRHAASDVIQRVLVLLLATTLMAGPLRESGASGLLTALRLLSLLAGVAAVASERTFARPRWRRSPPLTSTW